MKTPFAILVLGATFALGQQRCDAAYPEVKCNTTDILSLESSSCQTYHIFLARGSDEPYPGRQGNVTKLICDSLGKDKCGFENIEFPANSSYAGKDAWCQSAAKGATNGQAQLRDYAQRCPKSKLILLGFSQGASVVQDILGGGGGPVFECVQEDNPSLDRSKGAGAKIAAVATFGAVARSAGQSYAVKEGKDFNGTRARTEEQLEGLNQYSSVLRDWCNFGDPICAKGSEPTDVTVHLNYFELYNQEIIDWVTKNAQKGSKVSNTAPSSSTSSNVPQATTKSEAQAKQSSSAETVQSGNEEGAAAFHGGSITYTVMGLLASMMLVQFL